MDKFERDLLIETNTLVKTLYAKVIGNGQPGLLVEVAGMEERLAHIERTIPTVAEKRWLKGSGVLTAITVIGAALAKLFGIPLPV